MQTPNKLDDYDCPNKWRRNMIVYSICTTNNKNINKLKFAFRTINRVTKWVLDSNHDCQKETTSSWTEGEKKIFLIKNRNKYQNNMITLIKSSI